MATDPPSPSPQRVYRAVCPNCGAPVEFRSAASAVAVCGFCRSTLLREGDALAKIGETAELFDDHSPLQLGAAGHLQGVSFTLVGRLQYGSESGPWNEWHALFDSAPTAAAPSTTSSDDDASPAPRAGWLSEDNGAYVFAFDAPLPADAPAADELQPGERRRIGGIAWEVASIVDARLLAAEGELPRPPALGRAFRVADLRSADGDVATLDFGDPARPQWSAGRPVALGDLALEGLRETIEKTLSARTVSCPNCGAPIEVKLEATRSAVCPQCRAIVDLADGAGGGTAAAVAQLAERSSGSDAPDGARIPLGRIGRLALSGDLAEWQVVGLQRRADVPDPGDDEVPTPWLEYLLYDRLQGFAFLVDAEDGWSWMKPIAGAPADGGDRVDWQGDRYRRRAAYVAETRWVEGEFYWPVRRGERLRVADYDGQGAAASKRLAREEGAAEVVWSAGETIDASVVAAAFGPAGGAVSHDAGPVGSAAFGAGGGGIAKGLVLLVVLIVLVLLLSRCGGDDCDPLRRTFGSDSAEVRQCLRSSRVGGSSIGSGWGTSGGSYGGYSSGGSHK